MKLRSETSIKTERLWLRQIDETDAESIVSLRSKENVYKYFLNPVKLTIDRHKEWYNNTYINSYDCIDWIAVDDETGEFIGVYGAKKVDSGSVEVSYITESSHQHKGYAAEAVEAIILWCEKQWSIVKIIANIHIENKESINFAQKLGFKISTSRIHTKDISDNCSGSFIQLRRNQMSNRMSESKYGKVYVVINEGEVVFASEDHKTAQYFTDEKNYAGCRSAMRKMGHGENVASEEDKVDIQSAFDNSYYEVVKLDLFGKTGDDEVELPDGNKIPVYEILDVLED